MKSTSLVTAVPEPLGSPPHRSPVTTFIAFQRPSGWARAALPAQAGPSWTGRLKRAPAASLWLWAGLEMGASLQPHCRSHFHVPGVRNHGVTCATCRDFLISDLWRHVPVLWIPGCERELCVALTSYFLPGLCCPQREAPPADLSGFVAESIQRFTTASDSFVST